MDFLGSRDIVIVLVAAACTFDRYGRRKDFPLGVQQFTLAVEGGNLWGAYGLGYAYWTGKGVTRNVAKARQYFTLAADDGCGGALAYKGLIIAVCDEPGTLRNTQAQNNVKRGLALQVWDKSGLYCL